ncbi:MAG: TlpA disulfide reductase family protein [Ginsengibacter sp.]
MKRKNILLEIIILFCMIISSSAFAQTTLKNGFYKFSIERDDAQTIDFITLVKDSAGGKIMYIINGEDKMLVDSIVLKKDSVHFELPFFESGFAATIQKSGNLKGVWIKKSGETVRKLPFSAVYNNSTRFNKTHPASYNISGLWAVVFTNKDGKESNALGQFAQKDARVTGTFLTPYGDYRFLEGIVSGDSLFLSGFDGSYALYFTAKINAENTISGGRLYSGNAAVSTWEGQKDNQAKLKTPENTTKVKPGAGKLDFSFPDLDGNIVSLSDDRYNNKVVVIQIMGSWCPNCIDETKFFMENYDYYTSKGVEFMGISYERTDDYERSVKALRPFHNRFQIPYPILIAPVAVSDTMRTEKTLPQIENIIAFPTTIFIDKKGYIKKIHSGFDGPATGIHFLEYKKEFDETINALLKD